MSMEVLTAKVWRFRKHEYVGPDSKSSYEVQRSMSVWVQIGGVWCAESTGSGSISTDSGLQRALA
jgi:hypothetical protein